MLSGLKNTCDNCPVINVIGHDLDMFGEGEYRIGEERAVSEVVANALLNAAELDQAAGMIACREIAKDLPLVPDPMPMLGDPERVVYGRLCPAYLRLKEMSEEIRQRMQNG